MHLLVQTLCHMLNVFLNQRLRLKIGLFFLLLGGEGGKTPCFCRYPATAPWEGMAAAL